jgi:transcriptional regulator with XRE-family HTH domain
MGKPVVAHVTEAKNLSYMTLGEKLKALRRDLGLSQEALGAQGFVSTPGWIKIENGQRQASEKLIDKLVRWLIDDKYMRAGAANTLKEELLTLKYLGSRSTFVRELAKTHARKLPTGAVLLAAEEPGAYKVKPKRGRPPSQTKAIKG